MSDQISGDFMIFFHPLSVPGLMKRMSQTNAALWARWVIHVRRQEKWVKGTMARVMSIKISEVGGMIGAEARNLGTNEEEVETS